MSTWRAHDFRPRQVTETQMQGLQTLAGTALEPILNEAEGRQRT